VSLWPAGLRPLFSPKLKLAMIVGIDCYHDTTAGRRSIAGFVASINEGMTR
jgi:aubergine-like protein